MLAALCRPSLRRRVRGTRRAPARSPRSWSVTEAAVKQHLLRLYAKFGIREGIGRRARLANEVVSVGLRPGAATELP